MKTILALLLISSHCFAERGRESEFLKKEKTALEKRFEDNSIFKALEERGKLFAKQRHGLLKKKASFKIKNPASLFNKKKQGLSRSSAPYIDRKAIGV